MDDVLFREVDMYEFLESRLSQARTVIQTLTPEQMNGAADADLVAHFVDRFRIEPIVLQDEQANAEHRETQVDYSERSGYSDRSQRVMLLANQVTVGIPFTGMPDLFRVRPSAFTLSPPRAAVRCSGQMAGHVLIQSTRPLDAAAEDFNQWIRHIFKSIKDYVERSKKDVEGFNLGLPSRLRELVASRRDQLLKQRELVEGLIIPLCRRPEADLVVPLPRRRLRPIPQPRAIEQEYSISPEDYEYILRVMRHQLRSFEQTPGSYRRLDEESLRDILLSSLNTHFEGDAAGERFRRGGKTDICIEFSNRAAFVSECKTWTGAKSALAALDQLLGYLTWRDCHAALVLFNKSVKGFKSLQDAMPSLLEVHPRILNQSSAGQSGEWRAAFRARDDDGRRITVHVFLADLSMGVVGPEV